MDHHVVVRRTVRTALPLLALLALAACSAAGGNGTSPAHYEYSENEKVSRPIISGTRATGYPESALVDAFKDGVLKTNCSGVVIAPRVVLTAGHCIAGFNGWRVITPFASAQTRITKQAATNFTGNAQVPDPNQKDVGLIYVAEPLQLKAFPIVTDKPLVEGTMIVNVGRGLDGKSSNHDLSQGKAVAVKDATAIGFPNNYETEQVIETDDSGGPAFLTGGLPHAIVGVNATIGYGTQMLARTDVLYSWIDQGIKDHGGPGPSGAAGAGGASGSAGAGGSGGSGGSGGKEPNPNTGGSGAGGLGGNGGSSGPAGAGGTEVTQAGGSGGSDPEPNPTCSGEPELEPNDSAQPQALAASVCGELEAADDEDWFSFDIAETGVAYRVETVGLDSEVLVWKLVDGAYYPIENESPGVVANTANGPGTYYVAVWSPSGSVLKYRLTLETNQP